MGLLVEAFAGISGRLSDQLAPHRIANADFDVLLRLSRSPDKSLRMSDLAAQTTLSSSGITRVVDRLETAGLVRRDPCETDRRALYATITDAGLAKVTAVLPQHLDTIDDLLFGPLSAEQRDQLLASLRLIRDKVRPCAEAGLARKAEHEVPDCQ